FGRGFIPRLQVPEHQVLREVAVSVAGDALPQGPAVGVGIRSQQVCFRAGFDGVAEVVPGRAGLRPDVGGRTIASDPVDDAVLGLVLDGRGNLAPGANRVDQVG